MFLPVGATEDAWRKGLVAWACMEEREARGDGVLNVLPAVQPMVVVALALLLVVALGSAS